MELTLNLIWLAIAAIAFVDAPRHPRAVWLALICAAAILFPIVSASDDFEPDQTFKDAAAAVPVIVVLAVVFVAVARLRGIHAARCAIHVATPSDPRSPPAR